ncbi:hypothetical protein [Erythrobacter sp. HKB08]|uniref:hypothetical protein n=1 Tax=Erythrobacter sp. HKB08 TaxID=2502843 RepID=UPI0010088F4E|nr:hypothetical protein [Erythrobacter sp. HKB08]
MTDHPSTFHAQPEDDGKFDWDDRASLHRADDGGGVLDAMKGLRRGSFAELVNHVMAMPESERGDYVIQKAGDRKFTAEEIAQLSKRDDFPG